ncbi:MAG: hypothetical protein QM777_10140 [Pseudorhodoferax sp.]
MHALGDRSGISQSLREAANKEFESYRTALEDATLLAPLSFEKEVLPMGVPAVPGKFKEAMAALATQVATAGRVAVTPYSVDPTARTQRVAPSRAPPTLWSWRQARWFRRP